MLYQQSRVKPMWTRKIRTSTHFRFWLQKAPLGYFFTRAALCSRRLHPECSPVEETAARATVQGKWALLSLDITWQFQVVSRFLLAQIRRPNNVHVKRFPCCKHCRQYKEQQYFTILVGDPSFRDPELKKVVIPLSLSLEAKWSAGDRAERIGFTRLTVSQCFTDWTETVPSLAARQPNFPRRLGNYKLSYLSAFTEKGTFWSSNKPALLCTDSVWVFPLNCQTSNLSRLGRWQHLEAMPTSLSVSYGRPANTTRLLKMVATKWFCYVLLPLIWQFDEIFVQRPHVKDFQGHLETSYL